jgi:hypothetical protein
MAEPPHRHSATVRRPVGIGRPSWAVIAKSPRTISGPSSYTLTTAPSCPVAPPPALPSIMAGYYPPADDLYLLATAIEEGPFVVPLPGVLLNGAPGGLIVRP